MDRAHRSVSSAKRPFDYGRIAHADQNTYLPEQVQERDFRLSGVERDQLDRLDVRNEPTIELLR